MNEPEKLFEPDGGVGATGRGTVARPAADSKHSPDCARCGAPANRWSGAWLVTASKLWIGWCSNECKNAWLDGDKGDAQ